MWLQGEFSIYFPDWGCQIDTAAGKQSCQCNALTSQASYECISMEYYQGPKKKSPTPNHRNTPLYKGPCQLSYT